MAWIIEAVPNKVIKYQALVYKADNYPAKEIRISDYGRVKLYRGK